MTKEDVFKRLDKRLSKDERLSLAKAYELSDYHFGLGIWIRNNWFGKEEISSLFCDEVTFNGEDGMLFLPLLADRDIFSEKVLCEYQKYLREKYNVTEEDILMPVDYLLNALVRLDLDGMRKWMGRCEVTAEWIDERWEEEDCDNGDDPCPDDNAAVPVNFKPFLSIPLAWEWLLEDGGSDYRQRLNDIKKYLTETFSVDWTSVPEDVLPQNVLKRMFPYMNDQGVEDVLDDDMDTLLSIYRRKDIEMYLAAELLDFEKAKLLLQDGADPDVTFYDEDNSAREVCLTRSVFGDVTLSHYVEGDLLDTYPTEKAYSDGAGTLIRSAAYAKMHNLFVSKK